MNGRRRAGARRMPASQTSQSATIFGLALRSRARARGRRRRTPEAPIDAEDAPAEPVPARGRRWRAPASRLVARAPRSRSSDERWRCGPASRARWPAPPLPTISRVASSRCRGSRDVGDRRQDALGCGPRPSTPSRRSRGPPATAVATRPPRRAPALPTACSRIRQSATSAGPAARTARRAPRPDRRQQPIGLRGDEHEHRRRRRLLERLQQGVLRVGTSASASSMITTRAGLEGP